MSEDKLNIFQLLEKEIAPTYRENYRQMRECFRQAGIVDDVFSEIAKYILPKDFIQYGHNAAMEYWFCYHPYDIEEHTFSIIYFNFYEHKVKILLSAVKVLENIVIEHVAGETFKNRIYAKLQHISKKFYIYNDYVIIDDEDTKLTVTCLLTLKDDTEYFNHKKELLKNNLKKIEIYPKDDFDPVQYILINKIKDLKKIKEILKTFSEDNYERDVLRFFDSV